MLFTIFFLAAISSVAVARPPIQRPLQSSASSDPSASILEELDAVAGSQSKAQYGSSSSAPFVDTHEPLFHPPLRTHGRNILDANDTRFKIASINWYGGSDELFIPSGLDTQHRSSIAHTIRQLGFNSVRLPYSDEMVVTNPVVPPHLLSANADLLLPNPHSGVVEIRALNVFAEVVNALTDAGLAVIINNRITHAAGYWGGSPCDSAWYNDQFGPLCKIRQTEEDWIENWETILTPHINNPLVIGADLRNEVRGLWGTMPWKRWVAAAEIAGNRLLRMNPDWLIFISGTGSGNFLDGARERPAELIVPDKVVYEAHVYSWSGWGAWGGMYGKRSYDSFAKSMQENWGYLLSEDTAPVWVAEFGVGNAPGMMDITYWKHLIRWLGEVDADWGYCALNPSSLKDSKKATYGLLGDDWETGIVDYRMADLLEIMPKQG